MWSRSRRRHDRLRQLLGVYCLGALPAADSGPLEAHLLGCCACLAECAELTRVVVCLAGLSDVDMAGLTDGPCR